MVDFHTHILPGIDDGSRNEEMTRAMLLEEARQGVELIAATPHFYARRMSVDGFFSRRERALAKTEQILRESKTPLPKLVAGAEVYYFPGIGRAKDIGRLRVGDTDTLLLELPFEEWGESVLRDVEDLLQVQHLHIVLAHVERYTELQKHRSVWNHILELPVTPQLNAESFLGSGFLRGGRMKRFCLEFLKEHPHTILGTDCHNLTDRKPNLAEGRSVIAAKLGEEALRRTEEAAAEALNLP